jgi:transposase
VVVFDLERMIEPMSVRRLGSSGSRAVVVANARDRELQFEGRRFGTTISELQKLSTWLQEGAVQEVVMESTAQYRKPVWCELEGQLQLWLAQARSNRGPRGRENRLSGREAQREPTPERRVDFELRSRRGATGLAHLTRTKYQLRGDRVRLQSQLESLLEECQIKLSRVVSDLLGASGQRILRAIAAGETDPARLRGLGDRRLHATDEELRDALNGQPLPLHRKLLTLYLQRLDLIEGQIAELESMIAEAMRAHEDGVVRLSQLPGLGVDSAQQIIAEIDAPPAEPISPRRRAQARLLPQIVFKRLSPRLGYAKAVWAIAHRLCRLIWKVLHEGVQYVEYGPAVSALTMKRRKQRLVTQLAKLGYSVQLTPILATAAS